MKCFSQEAERLTPGWGFPFQRVPQGKRIVLYGAGKVGQAFYRQLTALSWAEEIIWADQNAGGYESLPDGRRLFAPAELAALDFDVVVIAVADRAVAESIARTLAALGVAEEKLLWGCLPASLKLRKTAHFARLVEPALRELKDVGARMGLSTDVMAAWQERIRDTDALVLPRLVVELTNRCTLRCRYCNNLMPLVKAHWDADPVQAIADVRRILAAVDGIVKVELLGGRHLSTESCRVSSMRCGTSRKSCSLSSRRTAPCSCATRSWSASRTRSVSCACRVTIASHRRRRSSSVLRRTTWHTARWRNSSGSILARPPHMGRRRSSCARISSGARLRISARRSSPGSSMRARGARACSSSALSKDTKKPLSMYARGTP